MNLTNWYADHLGQHLNRRRVDPVRSLHMPPRPMRPQIAALAAELLAERNRLNAGELLRDEFAAASVDFMLRTQDALHERELARACNRATLLAVLLAIVSSTLFVYAFVCAGPH